MNHEAVKSRLRKFAPPGSLIYRCTGGIVIGTKHGADPAFALPILDLMSESNDAQLEIEITCLESALRSVIHEWEQLPCPAQEALFDMAFDLGIGGLGKHKKLLGAVAARDWAGAAAECHRTSIRDTQNAETADLFRQAASAAT